MATHTQEPWLRDGLLIYALRHNGDYMDGGQPMLVNKFHASVEACCGQGGSIEEAEANARLMAAAPDLLAALKQCEAWVILAMARDPQTTHPQALLNAKQDHELLRAAIAKAEGQ